MHRRSVVLLLLAALTGFSGWAGTAPATASASSASQPVSITLDNVPLVIEGAALPSETFAVSPAGSASQMASWAAWQPFRELSITTVPFGSKAAAEDLPPAASGAAGAYRSALRAFRLQQGGKVQDAPAITLFGSQVTGTRSTVMLPVEAGRAKPVMVDEWVTQAGNRLWIVRASQEQADDGASSSPDFASGLSIDSSSPDQRTTMDESAGTTAAPLGEASPTGADLPAASWWNGDCDYTTYYNGSTPHVGSFRLGAVYLGMPACGPRPWADHADDVMVRFAPGMWGELEWECVELSMRFMYLKWGIPAYSASGKDVVNNYPGDLLVSITNGTAHRAPQPNDVLSYGPTSQYGHTSVVTASNVDANGNGTITIIEQNASPTGSSTLGVSNWMVSAFSTVTGWLHDPTADTPTNTSDFDGDGRTDPAMYDAATRTVSWLRSSRGTWGSLPMGNGAFNYVARSNFDGDGKTDPAKFVTSANSLWYYKSSTKTWEGLYMGPGSYDLIPASDFDGDHKTDPALFLPSANALWYRASSTGTWQGVYMGPGSYQVLPGSDFDGDGKTDPALYYAGSNSLWYFKSSSATWQGAYLGAGTIRYVPASDFDGDGKTDPAQYTPATHMLWYLKSSTGTWTGVNMGAGSFEVAN